MSGKKIKGSLASRGISFNNMAKAVGLIMTESEWMACQDPDAMIREITSAFPAHRHQMKPCARDRKLQLFRDAEWWNGSLRTNKDRSNLLRDIFGNPWRPVELPTTWKSPEPTYVAAHAKKKRYEHCPWLRWNDGAILALAREVYGGEAECKNCEWFGVGPLLGYLKTDCPNCHGTSKTIRPFNSSMMPVLHDILVDAGCTDEEILHHCRGLKRCSNCLAVVTEWAGKQPNPANCWECKGKGWVQNDTTHVRGCWVVDLLLGKE